MGVDKTNRKPRKYKKRKAKGKNKRQDQRIKALEKTVYTALERKVKTWQNGTWSVDTGGRILNNSNIQAVYLDQGTGTSQRVGNEISLLNQTVRYNLRIPDLGDAFNQLRMLIVESTDGSQSLALTDVLEYGDATLTSAETVISSPYKIKVSSDNKGYKVHFDQVFELNTYKSRCITGEVKIKYGSHGKKVEYPALVGLEQPTNHNLHIMLISDSGTTPHPMFAVNVRSRFYDA